MFMKSEMIEKWNEIRLEKWGKIEAKNGIEMNWNYLFGTPLALPSKFLQALPTLPISGSWIEPKYGWWYS